MVLGALFVIAYVLGRLGKLIGLPAIPIYMVVGLLASPNTGFFPLNFDSGDIGLIAVFGLILLLFNLGLEFDQDEFFGNAGRLLISGGTYIVLNMGIGFLFGEFVGWGTREALIIAGMVGTSSSAIITKMLIELGRLANNETPAILGATVIGDVFIAVYLAIVSVVLSGQTEFWPVVLQLTIAAAFLVVMFTVARYGGRFLSRFFRTRDDELFTILFFGLAVLFAGLGELIGVTDAIGAFLIGLVLGATRFSGKIERISIPLRDVFAAFFFLNFGLALNVAEFGSVAWIVVIAIVLTVVLNVVSGQLIALFNRLDTRDGINIAAVLMNRGEFTLILATLSLAAGLNEKLEPFAGLYVLIMAILGPVLTANSERIGAALIKPRRRAAKERNPVLDEEAALVDAVTSGQLDDEGDESDGGDADGADTRTGEPSKAAIDRIVEEAMRQTDADDRRKQN
ncbi:cation:proton antiporter [Planctomonas sp. JC2975]|uniref:cation:proton antiporter n=1 Tax=Planctomonas sp. JC2975 TaxID=2729626 RepID=UPI0014727D66|nr:cation:proton antiporter [Planctomonas sp. JC2975]NNC11792.1 cation:proton antiporter [Planctomonas sp. JC2975]